MRNSITRRRLGLATLGLVADTTLGPAVALQRYRWKNRPLLVFAGSASDPLLAEQLALIANQTAELRDRDMVIITVIGNDVAARLGPGPRQSAESLRRRYGVRHSTYQTVLVGKDGGAKIRSSKPISPRRLYATIDAMPMRRQEMRRRG